MSSLEAYKVSKKMKDIVQQVLMLKFNARETIIKSHEIHRKLNQKYDVDCPACVYLHFQLRISPNETDQKRGDEFWKKVIDKHDINYVIAMIDATILALGAGHRPKYTPEEYDRIRTREDEALAIFWTIG